MARMREDRQRLVNVSRSRAPLLLLTGSTYTWFSPLGAKNHDATHMATMTARPMKMEYLCQSSYVSFFGPACSLFLLSQSLPLCHIDEFVFL